MAHGKTPHTITTSRNFAYKEKYDLYTIQLVRKRKPWWLLLLLLLFLFVKCEKDITVTCVEPDTNTPVAEVPVTMNYTAHYLFHNGRPFANEPITRTQKTDSKGETVFKDLPCSVYSYIFYCLSKVSFTAKSQCHAAVDQRFLFHFVRHAELEMEPRKEDLHVRLVDKETGDVLPDGVLIYKYVEQGKEVTDSAKADAAGIATLPQMRYCGVVKLLRGRCYGYADTTRADVPCQRLVAACDSTDLRLRPIKARFTFFVKNKESRQPIPDATCTVTLTHPGKSKHADTRTVKTSIDGNGIAVYDKGFILATISITASKVHYKTNNLKGGPFTVEKFIKQPDSIRTIWLEPEPYMVEFINVDSINGKPIPGVKNVIKITSPGGQTETVTETSNRNGIFPVTAKEGSRIEIISTKSPDYKQKNTVIKKFKDKEKIRMQPVMKEVSFQTVKSIGGLPALPQCNLSVNGSISGNLPPGNSGNSQFTVKARMAERLSIKAFKSGYTANNTTVNNEPVANLEQGRKIPLKPSNVSYINPKGPKGTVKDCYDMKEDNYDFIFQWKTCSVCTMLVVTDANGNVLGRFGTNSPAGDGKGQKFSNPEGSARLHSSTQTVCVTRTDVNGCTCWYKLSK